MSINTNPEDNNTNPEETEAKPKATIAELFAKWFEKNLKSRGNTVEEFFAREEDEDETEETNKTEKTTPTNFGETK